MTFDIRNPNVVVPIDTRSEPTPGAENKPTIVPTEGQNRKMFVDTAPGHGSEKQQPNFPSK